ncbi:MAG: hypothetical protein ACFB4J_14855 [Elainellaceae cyanobacterium]
MMRHFAPRSCRRLLLGILLAATLSSCGESSTEVEVRPESPPAEAPEAAAAVEPPPAEPSDREISTHGIGPAQLGLTLGELKQLFDDATFTPQSPFLAEFDAIAVRQGGEILFHILHLAGEPMADEDVIQGVFTTNPSFETAEGIGAGTPIAQAEATYGSATLSHHRANASLEYVRFATPPADNISFGTWARQPGEATPSYAGVYPPTGGDYRETTQYDPEAQIQSILVVCLTEICAS